MKKFILCLLFLIFGSASVSPRVWHNWRNAAFSVSSSVTYFLDTYPDSAAAFSLRVLSSSFANSAVVKVRRSSDNAESDFKAAEVTNGTLTTWVGANNAFVTIWYDQSGHSRNATQSVATNQPMIVTNGNLVVFSNNIPAISFYDNYASLGQNLSMTIWHSAAQQHVELWTVFANITSIFFSYVHGGTTDYGLEFMFNSSSYNPRLITARATGLSGGNSLNVVNAGQAYLHRLTADRTNIFYYVNNSTQWYTSTDRDSNFNSGGGTYLLGNGSVAGKGHLYISEMIMFTNTMNSYKDNMEDSINSYFSLY